MIDIGQDHNLTVLRFTIVGAFLGNNIGDEILLPNKYIPKDLEINDSINVFVYKDSEDRPIATTLKPKAYPNQFARLEVTDVSRVGAFVDIGLEKEVLIPFREQSMNLERGQWVTVFIYLDEISNRLVASTKLHKFTQQAEGLEIGDEVQLVLGPKTDIGYKVFVNHKFQGMLYHNEVFTKLSLVASIKGFVAKIREDGKVDVRLQQDGYVHLNQFDQKILEALEEHGGEIPVGDKSNPEEIYALLGVSKKNFKKAVGALYKAGKVLPDSRTTKLKQ